jgi:uncharacterized protein YhaN
MKLIRLTLDSWRGVDHREINFSDGVTLIEGPNEIGKSTIVEAIHTLFREMESSNKQNVKAIQPVGKDVGSKVEAEVITGDYHFIYSKTYNKSKQTALQILKPKPEQLTGREAHERAEQILDETIDMALWNALLVEQGKEISGANLANSAGLALALDAAAGTPTDSSDDSALYAAVQSEYEKYFTLKAGKSRITDQQSVLESMRDEVASARASLAEVEIDAEALQRSMTEAKRLEDVIPGLKNNFSEYEGAWKAIEALNENAIAKASELASSDALYAAAERDLERRRSQTLKLAEHQALLKEHRELLAPQAEQLQTLKSAYAAADQKLKEARESHQAARASAESAIADEKHINNVQALQKLQKQLAQVSEHSTDLVSARQALSGVKIDANKLDELRDAERELQIALAKRDASASLIEITAEKTLQFEINDEEIELADGESDVRSTAASLNVRIPGVAAIRVSPSQSAGDLEAELDRLRTQLDTMLLNYGVKDLADAIAVEARRVSAEQEVKNSLEKIEELLNGELLTERQGYAEDLGLLVERYITERLQQPPLQVSLKEAAAASSAAGKLLTESEGALSSAQAAAEELRDEQEKLDADCRVAAQEVLGMERTAEDLQNQFTDAQAVASDSNLEESAKARLEQKSKLENDYGVLRSQLDAASPDVAEALLSNARDTLHRAEKDSQEELRNCAVLEDRLTKAQADGRFETLENTEHKLQALDAEFTASCRRADAAKRLWDTISKHRDNTRKAYVKPLKEGIERLGKIVFGTDFEVELDDGWQLISRTQAGQTIPFDDLSVGTKEQLGILTRLAAARIVASQGGVPLIIDDALGFSDPGRLESMGAAIASAGKDCQVILLTCTPGRFMHVGNAEVVRF